MAVSANTLFHFTKRESLEKILISKGFYCQYSDEHFESILPKDHNYKFSFIPMTCFCDLTISQLYNTTEHRSNFGNYAIGLKKEWGIRNKVSPVIYVHPNSQHTKTLDSISKKLHSSFYKKHDYTEVLEVENELVDSFKYIKPYKGRWHKGRKIKKGKPTIIYYNEREWRYCPSINEYPVLSGLYSENKLQKKTFNNKLKNDLLKFNPSDIKFIIIKSSLDIDFVIKAINKMGIKQHEKNDLYTKIITQKEIMEDYL